ncbi:solute carrier family 2, facilitated glucose transporter member 5-like [Pelodytes ibericus]
MDPKEEREGPVERKGKLTTTLVLVTLIATVGTSFQYGYNVASVNSPAPFMKTFYNDTYIAQYESSLNDGLLRVLWSLTVSLYPLGGFFGSLLVGPLVNKIGRKGTLLLNNIFSIGPALLMGTSVLAKSFQIIIVSRLVIGICAGLCSTVPMYLGEMSPKNLRGAIVVIPELLITIGILMAQIFGIRQILGNTDGWPILLALTGIPAVMQLVFLPFFPESPRYTLINKRDEHKAKTALQRLRGWEDVDDEMKEIYQEDQSEKAEGNLSVKNLCTFRPLRWQLITIIVLNMGQQLSGINAVYYYADSIYTAAGIPESTIQYVTVATGSVNVLMTLAAIFIVDSWGRRILLLAGFGTCCVSCVVLTIALAFQKSVSWMPYLSIVCVIMYVIGHAIGPSPIPCVITTEMFRQASRPSAFMVAGSVHWLSNCAVGLLFEFALSGLGPYAFIIFASISLATFIFIYIFVPETKGKTFLEISRIMAKRNGLEKSTDYKEFQDLNPFDGEIASEKKDDPKLGSPTRLVITVASVSLQKIGYDASYLSVGWYWINIEADDKLLWMLLSGKHAALSEYRPILSSTPVHQPRTMADKKLILIPIIFIFLRIWSTIRFILTLCDSAAVHNVILVILHCIRLYMELKSKIYSLANPDSIRSSTPLQWLLYMEKLVKQTRMHQKDAAYINHMISNIILALQIFMYQIHKVIREQQL